MAEAWIEGRLRILLNMKSVTIRIDGTKMHQNLTPEQMRNLSQWLDRAATMMLTTEAPH